MTGETVSLTPGGYHGMLMDFDEELKEGESFPVTLQFEKADEV
ncbi:copper chaperone PCu(A)C [Paracoccus benzoatiresistens]|uniref:Copper chaperone PCu(A)C n=1 Tax=Paracoccus benzoatiresistens TaxID=2997341 RepID=A0ABT4JBG7_9RHOB|nr:copper chaperone PCu(A)C [Paracoccus sp. EF6]MCZ0964405.1 copper chaperone PCu(A)C [Paracoccus sp. EF6]